MAQVTAQLNNLRLAPRKVRAVSNLIKGKSISDALNQLEAMTKRPSLPVIKLLKSALSNAENTYDMVKDNLYVKSIIVNEGVKLKRFKPKGFGRVSPIEKKTSHLKLILAEKTPGLKRKVSDKKVKEEKQEVKKPLDQTPADAKASAGRRDKSIRQSQDKPEIKTELGRKEGVLKSLGRRVFRRKSI